mmetsp:Transcript_4011/g.7813  ORF Transcript_4011/g.7813 Transcript_4011/m.7813 type:complete len:80 (+) Transcript_4011:265-504(+)
MGSAYVTLPSAGEKLNTARKKPLTGFWMMARSSAGKPSLRPLLAPRRFPARRTRKSCRLRSYLFYGSQVWEIVTGMEEQ